MKLMDLHVTKHNRLIHIQLNRIVHEELEPHPEYVAKLRTVLKNNLINACEHSFAEVYDSNSHAWLKQCLDFGYELAVVWFDGSWPSGREFEQELLRLHDTDWAQKNWMLAGHIINRPGQYPKWHHQCVIVNLKAWEQDNCPNPNKFGDTRIKAGFLASAECMHDDYTPLELCPDVTKTDACGRLKLSRSYFDPFIHQALGGGYQVLNLPQSLRDHKSCAYPEDDIAETLEWLQDLDHMENRSAQQVQEFVETISEDKISLYQCKAQQARLLYITNTESVPQNAPDVGFTKIAVPCSGLHQFWHIANSIDTLKQVLWFDFSELAVAWTQIVLSDWDGRNFTEFFRKNIHRVTDQAVVDTERVLFDPELVDEFVNDLGGEDVWAELFGRIKKLHHEFHHINIVKNWQQFAEHIGSGNRVFLQVSNIWQYESNYLNTAPFQAQLAFINLIKTVLENNQELYLTGDTPGGIHYTYQNVKELTGLL